ncbi:MAG: DNA-directed RNA polymerase subunit H [Candidatus Woesearchaeota archaeon]
MAKKAKFDISNHVLVPKHAKLSEKETEKVLKKYNIPREGLPKIMVTDPAIAGLGVSAGDVIKVTRESPTAGKIEVYRCVIDGKSS